MFITAQNVNFIRLTKLKRNYKGEVNPLFDLDILFCWNEYQDNKKSVKASGNRIVC